MPTNVCLVLVTCGNLEEAETMAKTVVQEKLAACVNLVSPASPVRSFYMWEGALQNEPETLLVLKTREERLAALEQRIQSLHSYAVPEFIVLPVISGSKAYLDWVAHSVS